MAVMNLRLRFTGFLAAATGWRAMVLCVFMLLAGLAGSAAALAEVPAADQVQWVERDSGGEQRVHLYFFWSETCPHCEAARPFVTAIPLQRPWVVLHSLEVSRNREHARRFETLAAALGEQAEAVPTLMFCGRMEVGWQDAASSGAQLLAALDACRAGAAPVTPGPHSGPYRTATFRSATGNRAEPGTDHGFRSVTGEYRGPSSV